MPRVTRILADLAVWYLNRYHGRRYCTSLEIAAEFQFIRLMADPDVNRIVREKPVDYMGWQPKESTCPE